MSRDIKMCGQEYVYSWVLEDRVKYVVDYESLIGGYNPTSKEFNGSNGHPP
jgi:hypothetical protein